MNTVKYPRVTSSFKFFSAIFSFIHYYRSKIKLQTQGSRTTDYSTLGNVYGWYFEFKLKNPMLNFGTLKIPEGIKWYNKFGCITFVALHWHYALQQFSSTNLHIVYIEYPKKSLLTQATPKNTCQNVLESKCQTSKKIPHTSLSLKIWNTSSGLDTHCIFSTTYLDEHIITLARGCFLGSKHTSCV